MLVIRHLHKTIGSQSILRDIQFEVKEKGAIIGLLGPNGAGKSTLMKIMVGLWYPDKCADTIVRVPQRIGYLAEQNPLYTEMYVREFLEFCLKVQGEPRATRKEKVEQLIEMVGLTPEANKQIGELSKGYRQRVGIAQALIGDPELLILDEPTTGLDPNQLVEIRQLIRSLGKDRIVILSTHIMQEVREMCDRVILIDHGQIKADKPINEIKDLEQLFRDGTGF